MMLKKMFSFTFFESNVLDVRFVFVLVLSLVFAFMGLSKSIYNYIQNDEVLFIGSNKRLAVLYPITIICLLLSSSYLLAEGFNPFIYFRF
jgi:succinate dehydrogenase hydrophobic anchor subunit